MQEFLINLCAVLVCPSWATIRMALVEVDSRAFSGHARAIQHLIGQSRRTAVRAGGRIRTCHELITEVSRSQTSDCRMTEVPHEKKGLVREVHISHLPHRLPLQRLYKRSTCSKQVAHPGSTPARRQATTRNTLQKPNSFEERTVNALVHTSFHVSEDTLHQSEHNSHFRRSQRLQRFSELSAKKHLPTRLTLATSLSRAGSSRPRGTALGIFIKKTQVPARKGKKDWVVVYICIPRRAL